MEVRRTSHFESTRCSQNRLRRENGWMPIYDYRLFARHSLSTLAERLIAVFNDALTGDPRCSALNSQIDSSRETLSSSTSADRPTSCPTHVVAASQVLDISPLSAASDANHG